MTMRPNKRNITTINDATRDRLNHMKELECSVYKRPLRVIEPFNGQWRKGIIEWMYAITHYCGLKHEAVAAAVYYLDASVEKKLVKTALDYQIAAMTAFHLGLKVFDSPSIRMVRLGSLVNLGSGGFGEHEVLEMESKMLFALEWRMNPPTTNCFLYQYMTLLPDKIGPKTRTKIECTAMALIERVMSTDYFSLMESSLLAHAAVLLAVDMVSRKHMSIDLAREFMENMGEVTHVERNNKMLSRCILLLDCIANQRPIPFHELDNCTGRERTKSFRQSCQQQHSPRGYDLRQ